VAALTTRMCRSWIRSRTWVRTLGTTRGTQTTGGTHQPGHECYCAPTLKLSANNWFGPTTSTLVRHPVVGRLFLDEPFALFLRPDMTG
jgi:hypothetical protein